jgi:3-isopropylmalate/(R)-2-methylmalate dehydratase small subunit
MIRGNARIFGDDVNTDVIIPARYLNTFDPAILGQHAMEGVDPQFSSRAEQGDIIIAGSNFGCGSSREHAPIAIQASGISAVVATSFARIFFRNAINVGLPALAAPDLGSASEGDTLDILLAKGEIHNLTRGETYGFQPLPEFLLQILEEGGLLEHTKKKLGR